MNPLLLYRVAAGLLAFFAIGHTVGLLPPRHLMPEAKAVRDSMFGVHFQVMGADSTWGGFYLGFGLFVTVYLLFAAIFAWQIGNLSQSRPQEIQVLAWTFFVSQVATAVLSWKYFFLAPTIFSILISICVGLAAWKLSGS
jgi:hypothetical protein